MLGVSYHQSERGGGTKAILRNGVFSTRGLKDTLQISRCRQIENAINASKVVARDQAPLALGGLQKIASNDVAGSRHSKSECRNTDLPFVRL
jgi:hypothetical protein